MKTLLAFLSLLLGFAAFSQTNEQILKNNNWYLDHVVINGNIETPIVDQEIPYAILNFNPNDLFVSTYCNNLFGNIEIHEDFYSYTNFLSQTLQHCDTPTGIMALEYLYFDFFFTDQTQPFYYEITTGANGAKTLTITSASDDKAVYGNQQMSVQDVSQVSFQLYPNPVKNAFHLQSKNAGNLEIVKVYNLNGKEVLQFGDSAIYDISGLQKGVYFVEIKSEEGIFFEKIIKE